MEPNLATRSLIRSKSLLIVVKVVLVSLRRRLCCADTSVMLLSRAEMEVLRVVLGDVGDEGRTVGCVEASDRTTADIG